MDETAKEDREEFEPWPERLARRHPWLEVFGIACWAMDLAYLGILVAAFGAVGIAYRLFGGAPP